MQNVSIKQTAYRQLNCVKYCKVTKCKYGLSEDKLK